ncbi:putative Zn peptidase [Gottschalkia purinilytica]|uniref:Putative Zn peptidase n=1 Tax=Gottschalkia purinilytica TaxID=1503 RepID=A0A0L0WF05_GOTPU|nr:ImmA/IrrE family metallo-endopeptidase [Gottschalkia purinilytica]KNF10067.1 putative Zn peptidase [Gottschalkia purinilytica]
MNWIDDYVYGLIEFFKTDNIYDLYDYLGIQINKLDKDNILLLGNDGLYHRDFLDKEIVFIRNDLSIEYEKFILAHELGHAIIHTDIYNAAFNKSLVNKGKIEKQANYFAFKLLNIKFDSVELEGFTLDQISHAIGLPTRVLDIF